MLLILCNSNIHLSKIVAITTVFHLPFHRVGLYVMLLICPVCCKNETSSHMNIFGSVFLSLLCCSREPLHLHVDKNQTNQSQNCRTRYWDLIFVGFPLYRRQKPAVASALKFCPTREYVPSWSRWHLVQG